MEGDQRTAIQDIVILYAHLLDSGQHGRVAEAIFTADAVIDYGAAPVAGRAAIAAFFAGFSDMVGTSHNVSNFIVEVTGDVARCQSHCMAWHWLRHSEAPAVRAADVVAVGGYQDALRREPAGWRIAHRRMLSFGGGLGIGAVATEIRPVFEAMLGRRPDWP